MTGYDLNISVITVVINLILILLHLGWTTEKNKDRQLFK